MRSLHSLDASIVRLQPAAMPSEPEGRQGLISLVGYQYAVRLLHASFKIEQAAAVAARVAHLTFRSVP